MRKGEFLTLKELIGVIMVAIVLIVIFSFLTTILNIWGDGDELDTSKANLKAMADILNSMEDGDTTPISMQIHKDYFLIGFGEDAYVNAAACERDGTYGVKKDNVIKPNSCSGSCICLCSKEHACYSEDKPICENIKAEIDFKDDGSCGAGIFLGDQEPWVAHLRMRKDEALICMNKC